jgi:hypothetical protein
MPRRPVRKMLEHHENRCAQAQRKRQKARAGEAGGVGECVRTALALENDLMVKRWRDE